jgi:chromosome segregation ATPase
MKKLWENANEAKERAEKERDEWKKIAETGLGNTQGLDALRQELANTKNERDGLVSSFNDVNGKWQRAILEAQDLNTKLDNLRQELANTKNERDGLVSSFNDVNGKWQRAILEAQDLNTKLDNLHQQLVETERERDNGATIFKDLNEKWQRATLEAKNLKIKLEDIRKIGSWIPAPIAEPDNSSAPSN